jgi:6-phosphofructokinase 1
MQPNELTTDIPTLGKATLPSPLQKRVDETGSISFVSDQSRVIIEVDDSRVQQMIKAGEALPSFELAGPRPQIYFDSSKVKCALVTCGGLCPGINDIIRSIVLELHYAYGVRHIFGCRDLLPNTVTIYLI